MQRVRQTKSHDMTASIMFAAIRVAQRHPWHENVLWRWNVSGQLFEISRLAMRT